MPASTAISGSVGLARRARLTRLIQGGPAAILTVALLTGCANDGPIPRAAAITISLDDFAIEAPDVVPAGLVEVHGLNDGDETHQAVFAELPDGVTANEYVSTFLQDPAATLDATDLRGGLQFVRPGHGQDVTVQLEPGRYLLWCGLPGPGPGESHLAHGMWTELTVEDRAGLDAPILDAVPSAGTIELINWAFAAPDTLRAGEVYTVVNSGTQVHEIGMASLASGATRDDVLAFLSGEAPAGAPPPFTDLSGTGLLSPGTRQTLAIDVPPGRYVLVCYLPDPDDGQQHFMKGMIHVVDVV